MHVSQLLRAADDDVCDIAEEDDDGNGGYGDDDDNDSVKFVGAAATAHVLTINMNE